MGKECIRVKYQTPSYTGLFILCLYRRKRLGPLPDSVKEEEAHFDYTRKTKDLY